MEFGTLEMEDTVPVLPPLVPVSENSTGVEIYTDGCVLVNPGGSGGWACVVVDDGEPEEVLSGGVPETTNNRMELQAVLEALKMVHIRLPELVEIVSDSQYVVKGLTEWLPGWKQRGWMRKVKGGDLEEVKNRELWEELDRLYDPEFVTVRWIKGHTGHRFNEMADELASFAARRFPIGGV